MTDTDNRGLLRVIKVPFDIKAIFLGGLGYILFVAGGWILDSAFKGVPDGTHVLATFFYQALDACSITVANIPLVGGSIGGILGALFGRHDFAMSLNWIEMLVCGIWFLAILSVFGGAICRVVSLRIARDESIGAVDALKFSGANLMSYVNIPVFLGIAIAFFVGCNALAGLVSSIPYLGPILFIVLYPLAILSAIIILLIAVGGVLGLFMMVSAVSTEKNGTLDAISRAFSYIYSRPVAFFFYSFLVFLVASIIVLVGNDIFLGTVSSTFLQGTLNDSVEHAVAVGMGSAMNVALPSYDGIAFFDAIGTTFAWFFTIILKLSVLGFVVSYILGGMTAIYFALRKDVDGTEDSEIYVEGMEDEEDFGLPPVTPPADEEKPEEKAEEEKAEEKAEEEKAEEEKAEEEKAEEEPAEEEEKPEAEPEAEKKPAAKKAATKKKSSKKKTTTKKKKTTTKKAEPKADEEEESGEDEESTEDDSEEEKKE